MILLCDCMFIGVCHDDEFVIWVRNIVCTNFFVRGELCHKYMYCVRCVLMVFNSSMQQ